MLSNLNVSEATAGVALIVMLIVDSLILCLDNIVLDLNGLTTNLCIYSQVIISVTHFRVYFPQITGSTDDKN